MLGYHKYCSCCGDEAGTIPEIGHRCAGCCRQTWTHILAMYFRAMARRLEWVGACPVRGEPVYSPSSGLPLTIGALLKWRMFRWFWSLPK